MQWDDALISELVRGGYLLENAETGEILAFFENPENEATIKSAKERIGQHD